MSTCDGPPPGDGYECVQDCGPPVVQDGDPPLGYHWLTTEQAAEAMDVSVATAERDWTFARAWLRREMSGDG